MAPRKKSNPEAEANVTAAASTPTATKAVKSARPAAAAAPKRHKKATPVTEVPASPVAVDSNEVARLAYSYFVERGYQPGDPVADWFRAENELRSRLAAN
jgi:hypothetical protein